MTNSVIVVALKKRQERLQRELKGVDLAITALSEGIVRRRRKRKAHRSKQAE